MPLYVPEPHLSEPRVSERYVAAPVALVDLRGQAVDELRYPASAALIVAGVPGAGKSTALHRFFGATADAETPPRGPADSIVLDSHQARNRWRHRLGWLPYPLWRPVVHVAHYAGIRTALREAKGPVVIHDCATFGWSRRLIARWSTAYGREMHVILIDVDAAAARAGQRQRGRRINSIAFALHCFRWRRLLRGLGSGAPQHPEPASTVILDRPTVNRIDRVGFAA
ncbi:AAA family ATPase [Nocardia sp. NPDC052566]|uniref:AAA family ATPase n=1 Tax=Nocardia sp. NPDC052566 TaxID=3364330 RepID=UPI0037C5D348